jgi:branched-chain amino acid transport system ATP-binding protein
MPILEGKGLTIRFGGLTAVSNVDFSVEQGEIFGLIGPNGAGKTTLFNLLSAALKPQSGSVRFKGRGDHRVEAVPHLQNGPGKDLSGGEAFRQHEPFGKCSAGRRFRA